ncbi:MAG TPA: hypothetical protein VFI91_06360 [Longimicrobiaceae bacterium]|nr:hypothetical protein [Longimicrobiaceae bacterium]
MIAGTTSDQEAPRKSNEGDLPVPPHPFTVVGVGASAGGLRRFRDSSTLSPPIAVWSTS